MNTNFAFSAEQACRLTGLTPRQLAYWSSTSFFPSQLGSHKPRSAFSRVYSFRDVVGLRVLAILRNTHKVPLQRLRELGQYLKARYTDPWSQLTFYVVGNKVFYDDQETAALMSGQSLGQSVLRLVFQEVAQDVQAEAEKLRQRDPVQYGKIARNRYVMGNEPVIEGTRIPTRAIWNLHRAGYAEQDILREYPCLTPKDVAAAVEYEEAESNRKVG